MFVNGEKSSGLSTPALAVIGNSQKEMVVNTIDTPLPTFTCVPLHKAPCRSLDPVPAPMLMPPNGAHTAPIHLASLPAEPLAMLKAIVPVAELAPVPWTST
jgi:hypothetical protein